MGIDSWTDSTVWFFGTGNQTEYVLNGHVSVDVLNGRPPGLRIGADVGAYLNWGSPTDIGLYLRLKPSNYYGLIKRRTDSNRWSKVQLWEVNWGAGFEGMPKRTTNGGSGTTDYAAWYSGVSMPKHLVPKYGNFPIFYRYPVDNSKDYFEIKTYAEMLKFPIVQNPGTKPPSVGGGRGNNPGWDGRIPSTGPGSGTPIVIGTNPPSSSDAQDIAWWLNYPPAASTNPNTTNPNPNTNKPNNKDKGKGQWVTGPDGKKYYLPPGIDFAGLQREYDRKHPKPETKIVVRMPKGYAARVSTYGTKPRIRQRYKKDPSTIVDPAFNKDGKGRNLIGEEIFEFPYIPQNIRYSDIGSQWQEIPRALNRSFVDWTGYKLMKVSMDFLVTEKMQVGPITTPNIVSDGLFYSVGAQLDILRRMATNKYPVTLEGLDDMLSVQSAYSRDPRGLQFVIQDLNITAGRRTVDINTGLAKNPSNIAAAQVSLTLQEIPIETVTIVKLPPLNLGTPLVGKNGGGGGGGVPSLGLQSDLLTGLKWEVRG